MTTIAVGISKLVAFNKEVTFGTAVAAGAQYLRRVSATLDLTKQTYTSAEILTSQQVRDMRHGVKGVTATLNGEISPGAYAPFFGSILRRLFTTGATSGALTNVTAAAGPPGTFTRAAGSWITDGFKIGDIVRWTGWTTGGSTANNARNYRITALTATVMTVGTATTGAVGKPEAVVAQASGDSVTVSVVGKKTYVPATGQINESYSLESWFPDVSESELFTGCRVGTIGLSLPPSGMATINIGFVGQNMTPDTTQFFTTPTDVTTGGNLAAVNGFLSVNGVDIALLTGLSINITGNLSTQAVVGSNLTPDVFRGKVMVSGQFTALFDSGTIRDYFINETEISLRVALTASNAVNADFVSIVLPRIKVGSDSKNDSEQAIIGTYSFTALELFTGAGSGTAYDASTIIIQDSLA